MYIIIVSAHQVDVSPENDIEPDGLEADVDVERDRRQVFEEAESPTYDPNKKMNHFDASGTYSMTLVKQERLRRSTRSVEDHLDHLEHPDTVESSLLAFINHSRLCYWLASL